MTVIEFELRGRGMGVVHIAGETITVDGVYQRQRCGWCGEVLQEYDLRRVAVPIGQPGPPASWPLGALVAIDGNVSTVIEGQQLPAEACARNPLTLVSFQ